MGGKIARYLNQLIVGNVFDAPEILENYATDRSALKIKPKFVALPETTDDVRKLMKFFTQLASKDIKVPIAIRGSGLDEMGADLSSGLVISTEKLNRLLESDRRERLVRVQAGITLKELNTALSVNGLTIPIGGHEMETIGGLISNCPSDDYAGKYGGIRTYVERIEVVLANGEILQTGRFMGSTLKRKTKEKTAEGEICRKLLAVAKENEALLKTMRKTRVGLAGYPMIARAVKKNTLDLMPLFFGAEGTLGVITEVILRAVPIARRPQRVVATFDDFKMAEKFLDLANSLKPRELNLYDVRVIKGAEETGKKLSEITKKMEDGFVVLAQYDRKAKGCIRKIESVRKVLPKTTKLLVESPKNKPALDELCNSLTSFLHHTKAGERVPILTDFAVPGRNLGNFLRDLETLERSLGLDLAIFGSYAATNYHLRPRFKIDDPDFPRKAATFLKTGAFLIGRNGGSITGGAPEGRVKAIVTNDQFTEAEKNMYETIKQIFDRYDILNSQVKLGANTRSTLTHFRTTSSAKIMI
ncbi:MAG: FAD-binding oxidoreductase [Candidatus Saccharibacteria bacterium]|nr:FAD-binding oxidoreductase [Candidatus Saccharibacteria bacterium]